MRTSSARLYNNGAPIFKTFLYGHGKDSNLPERCEILAKTTVGENREASVCHPGPACTGCAAPGSAYCINHALRY